MSVIVRGDPTGPGDTDGGGRFFRGLVGRWRPGPRGDRWDRLIGDAPLAHAETIRRAVSAARGQTVSLVCHCEICGAVVVRSADLADSALRYGTRLGAALSESSSEARDADESWEWAAPCDAGDLAMVVGDHRHDDDLGVGTAGEPLVRWYRLRAIGPWKDMRVTGLSELLSADPMLIRHGAPAPPLAVVNAFLLDGRHDVVRAGGVEFPPMQLDPAAWPAVRARLFALNAGLVDEPVPAEVDTLDAFLRWWDALLAEFPQSARQELRQRLFAVVKRLDGVARDSGEWHEVMADMHALQANALVFLRNWSR